MNEPLNLSNLENKVVGREILRVDGTPKAEGKAIYTDDMSFPGMLYGKLKRATVAHGKILKIHIEKALQLPGVKAILTGKDLPIRYGILPVTQDETALAIEKVRYAGEPVAAVCAVDERVAQKACDLIEVEYEPLPLVLSIEEAAKGERRVHESEKFPGNAHRLVSLEFSWDEPLEKSPYTREDFFYFAGNTHVPMEPHSTISIYEKGKLTIHSSHQGPYYLKQIVSKALGMSAKDLRIVVPYVGGGFGGKLDPFPEIVCSSKLSMITGRPVKITLSREEVFYNHRGRHASLMHIQTGFKEGKLQGLSIQCYLDGGAYGSFGAAATYYHGAMETTTYIMPSYKTECVRFYTNKAPCGPKRGHGTPQPRFALECHLDKVAEDLGMDPIELRLKNLVEPYTITANHLRITSCALRECMEKVQKESHFSEKWKRLPYGEGIGFAVGSYLCGAALPIYWNELPHSEVIVKADRSGTVSAYSGHTEIGQGSDSVLSYIVAEVLGLKPSDIHLVLRDSDTTPPDLGSYSSRVTFMMGNAAKEAAEKLKESFLQAGAEAWEEKMEHLYLEGGFLKSRISPDRTMAFPELCILAEKKKGALVFSGGYHPDIPVGPFKGSGVGPSPAYSFSACAVQLKVDLDTGLILPQRIWIAHDIGKCINQKSVEGQIIGGVHMALGEVLMEENVYNEVGLQQNIDLLDYKIPTVLDMPQVEAFIIESEERDGPYGAKEVGQGPLLPVIPAFANAVYDAIQVRFDEIPITPDKILKAMERGLKRVGPKSVPSFSFPKPIQTEGGGYVKIK